MRKESFLSPFDALAVTGLQFFCRRNALRLPQTPKLAREELDGLRDASVRIIANHCRQLGTVPSALKSRENTSGRILARCSRATVARPRLKRHEPIAAAANRTTRCCRAAPVLKSYVGRGSGISSRRTHRSEDCLCTTVALQAPLTLNRRQAYLTWPDISPLRLKRNGLRRGARMCG